LTLELDIQADVEFQAIARMLLVLNAITKEPVAENSDLLKPKRKDDNFDRSHSPPIKVL
jgi:hypothetical protein